LRRIEEHRRSSGSGTSEDGKSKEAEAATSADAGGVVEKGQRQVSPSNIETARMLFEEQLDFLDKEKEKLILELPPLASCPVASSEDLSSSDIEATELSAAGPASIRSRGTKVSLGRSLW